MTEVAITVEGLSKQYRIGELQASYGTLRDSLVRRCATRGHREASPQGVHLGARRTSRSSLPEGEVLGLIGRNGAGKSTLLRDPDPDHRPDDGSAQIRGRVGSLLEVGTGFHPELTGRENVYLNGVDPRHEPARDHRQARRDRRVRRGRAGSSTRR